VHVTVFGVPVPVAATPVTVHVAQFAIPSTDDPPVGVAAVVPVHEKHCVGDTVGFATYPDEHVKIVTVVEAIVHVAIPVPHEEHPVPLTP